MTNGASSPESRPPNSAVQIANARAQARPPTDQARAEGPVARVEVFVEVMRHDATGNARARQGSSRIVRDGSFEPGWQDFDAS